MHGSGGQINVQRALEQHRIYVETLEMLGLKVTELPPLQGYPDSCFVEDTAVVIGQRALLTRPGALSRRGEIETIDLALRDRLSVHRISAPGLLDGGDVMHVFGRIYVGQSHRTNCAGHQALGDFAAVDGIAVHVVPVQDALHLKSVMSPLGDAAMVLLKGAADPDVFNGIDIIEVPANEAMAANVVTIGETVLMPPACPVTLEGIEARGLTVLEVDTTEFAHVDGALTCLSILY